MNTEERAFSDSCSGTSVATDFVISCLSRIRHAIPSNVGFLINVETLISFQTSPNFETNLITRRECPPLLKKSSFT